ncbi:flavin reductase family protein [Oceaniradius stylonematis]|jgi:3-hydroxy-9,10-secoandrosta-1,3,5(10)-triene-9,17-dione monooxygenase reductase component|uniref:flavin reductase family protein n=2 Tax=Oceaniradius stylonematis TaxID=2184161 RepID=UPI0035D02C6E
MADKANMSLTFRTLFRRFTTGVAVVGVAGGDGPVGATVNSLTAVSLDPMLLLFCARNGSRTAGHIQETGAFSVNILTAEQEAVSRHYAGEPADKRDWTWHAFDETVRLEGANATFVCRLERVHPAGDHAIIVGRVTDMAGPETPGTPLLYHGGGYAALPWPGEAPEPVEPVSFWWTG